MAFNISGFSVVESCDQMADAMLAQLSDADIIIKVAAVADYKPVSAKNRKIKKTGETTSMTLDLTENPDILTAI